MDGSVPRRTDCVVIGAGQAGLLASHHLQRAGRDHVVLDRRDRLGGGWLDRWDDFRLVGPAWTTSLPGAPYTGADPDGFPTREEVVGVLGRYAEIVGAPVVLNIEVHGMRPTDDGWRLDTTDGPIIAGEVVVATGPFARPFRPPLAAALPPGLHAIHSHDYRNASALPEGGILVVGSGQTGVQLAEELRGRGRDVSLSVGRTPRVPRRYRGRDIFAWMRELVDHGSEAGVALPSAQELPDPGARIASKSPQLSGHRGGYSPDLRALARDGVRLLGRLSSIQGTEMRFDADLAANLVRAETEFAETVQPLFDAFIAAAGIEAPPAEPFESVRFEPATIDTIDVGAEGISCVIWATGYLPDYGWIGAEVTDAWGLPVQHGGVSPVRGLSFLGGLWQHDSTSSTLIGLARDARVLAEQWS